MEQTDIKIDRRIIKTKKAIRKAFSQLLCEKECSQIKVTEIAQLADINRKTFYNYYSGPEDVLEEIENDITAIYEKTASDLDFNDVLTDPKSLYMRLHHSLSYNSDLFAIMNKLGTNREFTDKVVSSICDKAAESICAGGNRDEEKVRAACYFAGGGIVQALTEWSEGGRKLSQEELADTLIKFVTCVFKKVM